MSTPNPGLHPPRWSYTVYGVLMASAHVALAICDVGRAFDMFAVAWPFYSLLIGTTSVTAAAIDIGKRKYEAESYLRAPQEGS